MKTLIFTFTDDMDIFRNFLGAEKYLEPWIVEQGFEAFDSEGRILTASVALRPRKFLWVIPTTVETVVISQTDNFEPEKFKSKLIPYLKMLEPTTNGDLLSKQNLEELIELAVKLKGYSD
ncbi:hypothetical protein [Bdellovibrio sp. HCB-162]|uniref:hypothetical protein n=1 Tax=Bdellovibrio sp. HCB-162 TaxID=3394234 RepID=UPI0039BD1526